MTDQFKAIRAMPEEELRGVLWRLNDPVLREKVPPRPGEITAAMERAKALGMKFEKPKSAKRRVS